MRIGIGYSKEERQRIICCCRQVQLLSAFMIDSVDGRKETDIVYPVLVDLFDAP